MLAEMSKNEQVQSLLNGQLQAGFINGSAVPPQLKAVALAHDEFVLCPPKTHPMARARTVDLLDLADERFVMFARDVAPANHDNVIAIFNRAGVHRRTVHAARQWLTIVAMVAHGFGVPSPPDRSRAFSSKGTRSCGLADRNRMRPPCSRGTPSGERGTQRVSGERKHSPDGQNESGTTVSRPGQYPLSRTLG